jgi:hypothetical protein
VLGTLALPVGGCPERRAPESLVGRWVSEDPRYAGRSLAIDATTIAFGLGSAVPEVHAIEDVDTVTGNDGSAIHTVRYRGSDGDTETLRLETLGGDRPALRFENHAELWLRQRGR